MHQTENSATLQKGMQRSRKRTCTYIHSFQKLHTHTHTRPLTHCTQMHPTNTCRLICLPGSLRSLVETHTLVWIMLKYLFYKFEQTVI